MKLERFTSEKEYAERLFNFLKVEFSNEIFEEIKVPHNVNIPKDFGLTKNQTEIFKKVCHESMKIFNYDENEYYENKYKKSDLKCDSCNSNLEFIYTPIKSIRGLKVYSCMNCNLMQSLPRIDHYSRDRKRRASSEADWGNIRYGKIFRTDFAIRKIKSIQNLIKLKIYLMLDQVEAVL